MGFLSTPSARRATAQSARSWEHLQHFYPRPPRGGRPRVCTRPTCCFLYFYPRPPRGGRLMDDMLLLVDGNFYPRPPRGGRQQVLFERRQKELISIHALREEGDEPLDLIFPPGEGFLSTPSARRATPSSGRAHRGPQFLSTPSARRATADSGGCSATMKNFYPRPPRGGRL